MSVPMGIDEALLTLAEVAVVFMGFSGLVTAFRFTNQSWSRFDSMRLWNMLRFSLALLGFSLLPLPWLSAGADPWLICSLVMALAAFAQGLRSTSLVFRHEEGTYTPLTIILAVGGLGSGVVLVMNAAGFVFERSFTGYLIGLLWNVAACALFFVRLVHLGFMGGSRPEDPDE